MIEQLKAIYNQDMKLYLRDTTLLSTNMHLYILGHTPIVSKNDNIAWSNPFWVWSSRMKIHYNTFEQYRFFSVEYHTAFSTFDIDLLMLPEHSALVLSNLHQYPILVSICNFFIPINPFCFMLFYVLYVFIIRWYIR